MIEKFQLFLIRIVQALLPFKWMKSAMAADKVIGQIHPGPTDHEDSYKLVHDFWDQLEESEMMATVLFSWVVHVKNPLFGGSDVLLVRVLCARYGVGPVAEMLYKDSKSDDAVRAAAAH